MQEIRLITLNPGHFHAALVQKEMYAQVAPKVHVYAPVGPDLIAHLGRIVGFNTRAVAPTQWELEVHAGPDYLERMVSEKPGSVVVLAGRNAAKMDAIVAALDAGLHVLADKPWILVPEDLPRLQQALDRADAVGLMAYDIMTERHEITSILQRTLLRDEAIFGSTVAGSPEEPGVFMESVHYLKKQVAGMPLRRPAWFFDVREQGEALSDVGTHLVDLVLWMLRPDQPIDAQKDVCLMSARRWPTVISRGDFQQITGESAYPRSLRGDLVQDDLHYNCNTLVNFAVAGVHVRLHVSWDLEAAAGGGDTHCAVFRGSCSRIEVRQGHAEKFQPELYVIPNRTIEYPRVRRALEVRIGALQTEWPGIGLADLDGHFRLTIPAAFRVGHEAHFAQVAKQFLRYVHQQEMMPAWEKPNMLAKYLITTRGVELSRRAAR